MMQCVGVVRDIRQDAMGAGRGKTEENFLKDLSLVG